MLHVSELLLERHDLESFAELLVAVREKARSERFLRLDLKPPFPDTPEDWAERLESAFVSASDPR